MSLAEPLLASRPRRRRCLCLSDRAVLGAAATLAVAIVALGVLSASPVKAARSTGGPSVEQAEVLNLMATRPVPGDGAAAAAAMPTAPAAAAPVTLAAIKVALVPTPTALVSAPAAVVATAAKKVEAETCAVGFPTDFMWGLGTAAYQIEGGVAELGRQPSIWDTFSHTPGKTFDGATGDVACDHIHRWPQDLELMASIGLKHYRLSLSWSRVMSWDASGRTMVPNEEGIAFYVKLLEALRTKGITAHVTLYHWDLPQVWHALLNSPSPPASRSTLSLTESFQTPAETGYSSAWVSFVRPQPCC